MKHLIDKMTANELISFIRLHTREDHGDYLVGTQPVTVAEINRARARLKQLNRAAFQLGLPART